MKRNLLCASVALALTALSIGHVSANTVNLTLSGTASDFVFSQFPFNGDEFT